MKKLILFLFLIITTNVKSQVCTTAVKYDHIETYNWSSGWNVGSSGGYYTNAFVSSNLSAAVIGSGNGSSPTEDGYYILPNTTGLISTNTYYLEFRLGSYKFGGPTAATAGTDVGDYVDIQYSGNGGASYTSELRITGNNNATWAYTSTAVASKTVSGTLTTMGPTGGGDRTLLGDGYSTIRLTLPAGTTQAAFRIYCRVNSAGEEWWLDDIILYEITPCVPLPIELLTFDVSNNKDYNDISWSTASELNNYYFTIERSVDAFNWSEIYTANGAGTTSMMNSYGYRDYDFTKDTINYYRLRQTDFNGVSKYFEVKYVNNIIDRVRPIVIKTTNIMGQEVKDSYQGLVIKYYSDGTTEKVYRSE